MKPVKPVKVGIVDYGTGNFSSLQNTLKRLGYRSRISDRKEVLDETDLLILPGVGAFPSAMMALHAAGLVDFLKEVSSSGHPMIGICLGMQLFLESSTEIQKTSGLGLIPGEVQPLRKPNWHIGWNRIKLEDSNGFLRDCDGNFVYFNHGYVAKTEAQFIIGRSSFEPTSDPFATIIKKENLVGIQFHAEKSQAAGHKILKNLIDGLCDAQ